MDTTQTARALSHQTSYLKLLVDTQQEVFIFLISGIRLKGRVMQYDEYTISLASQMPPKSSCTQLVYKHAISTIMLSNSDTVAKV